MNVTNVIMEQFNLDPLSKLTDDIFYSNYFENGHEFINSVLTEVTSTPVQKKNVFTKLLGVIKKILAWIVKQWNRFTAFIKRLFTRKSKSVDQIVEETIPEIAKSAKSSNNNSSSGKITKITFNPQISEKSPIQSATTIELAYKDLICKIVNDSMVFYPDKIAGGAWRQWPDNQFKDPATGERYVPSHGQPNAAWDGALMIYLLIDHPEYMDLFNKVIGQLSTKSWEEGLFNATQFAADVRNLKSILRGKISVQNSFGININQVNVFNDALTKLHSALDFYDDPNSIPGGDNPTVVQALNDLASLAFQLQFGVTLITGSMTKIHEIDARYIGSINDNETLSKFIEGCIKGNVPPKYVAFNAYSICSEAMRGDADQLRPAMGQTRLALFPRNKNVAIKVALNQFGVRANNAEVMVYEALKKQNKEDIIAAIDDVATNKCVISMEKANTNFDKTSYDVQVAINELRSQLREAGAKAGLTINIADIHAGNIGKRGNKWISIDYGFTER